MNKIIILILILFVIGAIILVVKSLNASTPSVSSSKPPMDPTVAAALNAGKNAGSSAAAAFVPNYVPPDPVEEQTILTKLLNMAKDFAEQGIAQYAFDSFVKKLEPGKVKTWKGLFGNNKTLTEKMKVNRSKTVVKRLTKKMIDSLKDVYGAAKLALGQVTKKTAQTVAEGATRDIVSKGAQKVAAKTEVRAAEAAAKFGAKAAVETEAGPVGAALEVVQAAGMALDMFDINHLLDWQENTTSAFDAQKRTSDNQFAKTANDNQMTIPLIAGPIDQIDPDIFSGMMESTEVDFITGITAPSNPTDAATIKSIQVAIINNFVKSTGSDQSSVTLRDAFNASTISTLTDEYQQQISNIAYNYICIQANGVLVNNAYCSFSDQNSCNLSDQDFTAYVAGASNSRSQYSEWKSKDYINQTYKITIDQANACIVVPSDIRTACQDGHKDIAGKMQHNIYDIASGRCFNTKQFCDSYGIQWDSKNRICTQSSTLKVFEFIFGSTITQGTKMVIDRAIDGTVHALGKLGPAGYYIGDMVKQNAILYGTITCAFCTAITNDFKIIMDVFTGNFSDIQNRLVNNFQQAKKVVDAIGGFFRAIVHDFFDLF